MTNPDMLAEQARAIADQAMLLTAPELTAEILAFARALTMQWRPIDEAPRDEWVYTWHPEAGHGMARWNGDVFPDEPFGKATHYMALPAAPKAVEGERR